MALAFSSSGMGTHSEGLVVKFTQDNHKSWTGNFQRGLNDFDAIFPELGERARIVIAGGDGYMIDEMQATQVGTFGGSVAWGQFISERNLCVFASSWEITAFNAEGSLWKSRRISFDGIRILKIEGARLIGEAQHYSDEWMPFTLDLATGHHTGGSYGSHE